MSNTTVDPLYKYGHMRICRRPLHVNKYAQYKTTNAVLHFHNAYEMIMIESGQYSVHCPDNIYKGSGPCIVLFRLGSYHGIIRENCEAVPYRFYVANFHQSILDMMPEHPICSEKILDTGTTVIPIDAEQLSLFVPLMKRLVTLSADYTYGSAMAPLMSVYFMTVLGYIYELLKEGQGIFFSSESDEQNYISKVIEVAIKAVEQGENISVTGLADMFHVSVTKLSKDFKKITDMPIKNMIDAMRLERAKKMLINGLSSGEVAEKCGFSSTNYFIQFFNKHTNMSPGAYRQTKREATVKK